MAVFGHKRSSLLTKRSIKGQQSFRGVDTLVTCRVTQTWCGYVIMTYCSTHQTMILIRSNKSQTKSQIRIRSLHLKLESYIGSYFDHWPFVTFNWGHYRKSHESHKTFYLVKPHNNHSVGGSWSKGFWVRFSIQTYFLKLVRFLLYGFERCGWNRLKEVLPWWLHLHVVLIWISCKLKSCIITTTVKSRLQHSF